jgi:hypothetical protein
MDPVNLKESWYIKQNMLILGWVATEITTLPLFHSVTR